LKAKKLRKGGETSSKQVEAIEANNSQKVQGGGGGDWGVGGRGEIQRV
jgi:hypothetical protein